MIQIEMSKDINDFSPKIISIFDKRQLICTAIACAYGLPIMMDKSVDVGFEVKLTVALALMFPVIACGWVKLYGMTLERFIIHIIKTNVIGTTKRYYATKNTMNLVDGVKKAGAKPAKDPPVKRNRKDRKKYRQDMIRYEAKK